MSSQLRSPGFSVRPSVIIMISCIDIQNLVSQGHEKKKSVGPSGSACVTSFCLSPGRIVSYNIEAPPVCEPGHLRARCAINSTPEVSRPFLEEVFSW